jgi:hypothetical protein
VKRTEKGNVPIGAKISTGTPDIDVFVAVLGGSGDML